MTLAPVVAAAGDADGWQAMHLVYAPTPAERLDRASDSEWVALSRSAQALDGLVAGGGAWTPLAAPTGFVAWTDDYASVLPVLRALNPEGH